MYDPQLREISQGSWIIVIHSIPLLENEEHINLWGEKLY